MDAKINGAILNSLIKEGLEIIPVGKPHGLMAKRISEFGFFEEGGLRFTEEDYNVGQLYAGLSVLARDMYLYLDKNPRNDAASFNDIVSKVHEEERKMHYEAFPYYNGLDTKPIEKPIASESAFGRPTIKPLGDRNIVHEWTFKPGKRLFIKFGQKFKDTICGADGPYEQFNGLIGQAKLPEEIAACILIAGFSAATFWYPLAVYLSILIVKTGLKTYCEP